jgi:hypothetical protein
MEFEDESNLKKKRTNSCLICFHARALNSHYYTPTKKRVSKLQCFASEVATID